MEIRENEKVCIFAPLSPYLDKYESTRLANNINIEAREVAIDLQYVEDCTIDFIDFIRKISTTRKVGIFNIPADIFTLINIMGIDKITNIFVNELDFEQNQRQLINRRFCVAK